MSRFPPGGGREAVIATLLPDTAPELWALSRCGRFLAVGADRGSRVDLYSLDRPAAAVASFRRGVLGSDLAALAFFHVAAAPGDGSAGEHGIPPPSWLAVAGASPTIHVFAVPGGPPVTLRGAMHAAMYELASDDGDDDGDGEAGAAAAAEWEHAHPSSGDVGGAASAAGHDGRRSGSVGGVAAAATAALAAAAGHASRYARRLGGQRAFTIARLPPAYASDGIVAVTILATPAPADRYAYVSHGGGGLQAYAARGGGDDDGDDYADVVSTSLLPSQAAAAAAAPPPPPPPPPTPSSVLAPPLPAPPVEMDFVLTAVTRRGAVLQYLVDATGGQPECALLAVHAPQLLLR